MGVVAETRRGPRLVTLGVVGIVLPGIGLPVAAYAWSRAARDLADMARGTMDRSCRRSTRWARRLGMMGVALGVLVVLSFGLSLALGRWLLSAGGFDAPY